MKRKLSAAWKVICMAGSHMKCKICDGWGGEWGHAKINKPICKECYDKGYR